MVLSSISAYRHLGISAFGHIGISAYRHIGIQKSLHFFEGISHVAKINDAHKRAVIPVVIEIVLRGNRRKNCKRIDWIDENGLRPL